MESIFSRLGGRAGLWFLAALTFSLLLASPSSRAGSLSESQIKVEQCKVKFSEGDYKEALGLAAAAAEDDPSSVEAHHYAGLCYMALKEYDSALASLEKAGALSPNQALLQEDVAWAALSAGKNDRAIEAAEAALSITPDSDRASFLKAQALMSENRHDEALALYKELSGSEAYGQAANYYAGYCLVKMGRTQEASDYFDLAASLGPETEIGKDAAVYSRALKSGDDLEEKKPWSVRVRLLYQYDSNIVPVDDEQNLPEDVENMEDGRVVLDLDAAYRLVDETKYGALVRYIGYINMHSKESDVDLMYHLGQVSGWYYVNAGQVPMKFGMDLDYSTASVGGEAYSSYLRASPEVSAWWTETIRTRVILSYMSESFSDPISDDHADLEDADDYNRDNTRMGASLIQHVYFYEGRLNVWAGYSYSTIEADGKNYTRDVSGPMVGAVALFPRDIIATAMFRNESRQYSDYEVNDGDKREELMNSATFSVQVPVYKWISAYGGVIWQEVDGNESNGVLDYDRLIYSIGMIGDF